VTFLTPARGLRKKARGTCDLFGRPQPRWLQSSDENRHGEMAADVLLPRVRFFGLVVILFPTLDGWLKATLNTRSIISKAGHRLCKMSTSDEVKLWIAVITAVASLVVAVISHFSSRSNQRDIERVRDNYRL
jgi:hypothetical protein